MSYANVIFTSSYRRNIKEEACSQRKKIGWWFPEEEETGSQCLTSRNSVLPGIRKLTEQVTTCTPRTRETEARFLWIQGQLYRPIWAIALDPVSKGRQEELHHKWMYSTWLKRALRNSDGGIPCHTYLPQLFFFKLAVKTIQLWCKDWKPCTP